MKRKAMYLSLNEKIYKTYRKKQTASKWRNNSLSALLLMWFLNLKIYMLLLAETYCKRKRTYMFKKIWAKDFRKFSENQQKTLVTAKDPKINTGTILATSQCYVQLILISVEIKCLKI